MSDRYITIKAYEEPDKAKPVYQVEVWKRSDIYSFVAGPNRPGWNAEGYPTNDLNEAMERAEGAREFYTKVRIKKTVTTTTFISEEE